MLISGQAHLSFWTFTNAVKDRIKILESKKEYSELLKLTLVNITIHHKISMRYQTSGFNSNIYVIWNVVWPSYKDLKVQGKQIIRKKSIL